MKYRSTQRNWVILGKDFLTESKTNKLSLVKILLFWCYDKWNWKWKWSIFSHFPFWIDNFSRAVRPRRIVFEYVWGLKVTWSKSIPKVSHLCTVIGKKWPLFWAKLMINNAYELDFDITTKRPLADHSCPNVFDPLIAKD